MNILFVTSGTERAPATRYRVSQYIPLFKKRGIGCGVFSIVSDFTTRCMIKSPDMGNITRLFYYALLLAERFIRSWLVIFRSRAYDCVFLQRVTFPFRLERILKKVNPNIVFDIDDAIYLPDTQRNDALTRLKRFIKEAEVESVLKVARCTIVENEYIKKHVSRFCSDIKKIPGPIDTDRYSIGERRQKESIVIGWIGSPATTPYLNILNNVFRRILADNSNVSLHLIGAGKYSLPGCDIKKISWDYNTEVEELRKFDIGIMSMPDNEWTRGKLGCKMLQYMAVGIPTVASDMVTTREIITNGINGFLVKTEDEWVETIDGLIKSYGLRILLGNNARKTIEEKCSLKKNADTLIGILEEMRGI